MATYDDAKPTEQSAGAKKRVKRDDEDEVCRVARERYARWYERERENINQAYEDLEFCWNDVQWNDKAAQERKSEDRPCLTVNRLPQFVHQVTGDMRQMKPGIKVVPVDSAGDKKTAEAMGGMCRYIENRSIAQRIYTTGADSQVSCGIGAWRVTKEYAGKSTFNQELRIVGVDDAVAIAVDPDAILPTREDAKWIIVPVDMTKEAFKEQYPDCPVEDFDTLPSANTNGWFDKDFVRVAEYWVKKPMKRTLALMPDGAVVDLTGKEEAEAAQIRASGARVEQRDSYKVCRYLITAAHILTFDEWPGMYIPIVFAVGEEIRIGRKIVRRGLVRSAKDPQRMFNYFCSAQAETVALQPKAPFMVTEKNVEKYQTQWAEANRKNLPYLPFAPDPNNGGQAPQRVQPPVTSQGITEGIQLAAENMKAVIGIYDASLGARSNETSGKAIIARQREGDTGSFVYVDNWTMAIGHTGNILIDLIPHVYDTERQIRIMGEDGKIDLKWINRAAGMNETDPATGELKQAGTIENDVTKGAYDVVLESGPSYTTKRQEAKEGMVEFIRSAPETAPAVMDLVAKGQDWPLADEFAQRVEAIAPPAIQKLIARQKKERGDEEPQQQEPPSPQEQLQMRAAVAEVEKVELENQKIKAEIMTMGQGEGQQTDPTAPMQAEGAMIANQVAAQTGQLEVQLAALKVEEQQLKNQKLRLEISGMGMGQQHQAEDHAVDIAGRVTEMDRAEEGREIDRAERLTGMAREDESHAANMERGAEMHAAKVKQMNRPQPSVG
jgi:hypothetical protein